MCVTSRLFVQRAAYGKIACCIDRERLGTLIGSLSALALIGSVLLNPDQLTRGMWVLDTAQLLLHSPALRCRWPVPPHHCSHLWLRRPAAALLVRHLLVVGLLPLCLPLGGLSTAACGCMSSLVALPPLPCFCVRAFSVCTRVCPRVSRSGSSCEAWIRSFRAAAP